MQQNLEFMILSLQFVFFFFFKRESMKRNSSCVQRASNFKNRFRKIQYSFLKFC